MINVNTDSFKKIEIVFCSRHEYHQFSTTKKMSPFTIKKNKKNTGTTTLLRLIGGGSKKPTYKKHRDDDDIKGFPDNYKKNQGRCS